MKQLDLLTGEPFVEDGYAIEQAALRSQQIEAARLAREGRGQKPSLDCFWCAGTIQDSKHWGKPCPQMPAQTGRR